MFQQVENHQNAVFPNAMIAGDCVITHLLHRLDYLKNGKVKIMVVDTFHLFPCVPGKPPFIGQESDKDDLKSHHMRTEDDALTKVHVMSLEYASFNNAPYFATYNQANRPGADLLFCPLVKAFIFLLPRSSLLWPKHVFQ